MTVDSATLQRVFEHERQDGWRDRMVVGGLEKLVANWSQKALRSELTRAERALVSRIEKSLSGYGSMTPVEREKALESAGRLLSGEKQPVLRASGRPSKRTSPAAPVSIESPVTALRGVTASLASKLASLGAKTIEDLLYLFPRRHDDYSQLKTINALVYGEETTVTGTVREVQSQRTNSGIQVIRAVISDPTGMIVAVWFNQGYLRRVLTPGRRVVLSGRVDAYRGRLTLQSPEWELWTEDLTHTGRLVPVYPLTEGLSAKRLRSLIKPAVDGWAEKLTDSLPAYLRERYQLMDLSTAVQQMHFPSDAARLEQARHRLCFDEFLFIQMGVLKQRQLWQQQPGRPFQVDETTLTAMLNALPFALTGAQQRVLAEIRADLGRTSAMSRLLQGDVGSGKTVVALLAMLIAIANRTQAAIMAPTEVLAEQHDRTLRMLLSKMTERMPIDNNGPGGWLSRVKIGLLKGSLTDAEKASRRQEAASGDLNILVGTHALIQEDVNFQDLGLVVIDEQHRFGVNQRGELRQKGYNPHVLVMTATPIPRTLSLTIYGDLDLSILDEMPPGRQTIRTQWLEPNERSWAYSFVRAQVKQGRQAFIVCPLIDESENIDARAATSEYERLQKGVFPDLRLGLLHGRMKSVEKERVMMRFRNAELDILVTTAVVEVGIDVPNATVMLIEGADRFGLSQLHQFRGRVGRGEHPSHCLLVAESPTSGGQRRLKVIESTHDGFVLAEEDPKLRGPGDFFGTRQSGLPNLRVAQLGDTRILERARKAASDIYLHDPSLTNPEHVALVRQVERFWQARTDLS